MLLYGLNLCFNYSKNRFINDEFIKKIILVLKKQKGVLTPSAESRDRIQ